MGIMDVVRKIGEKKKLTKEKFKQMQEDDRLNHMLEERKKSSNQRELERYMKENKEKAIKQELDRLHKKQSREDWKGNNLIKGSSILKDNKPILKTKNIFKGNKNNSLISGGFFK